MRSRSSKTLFAAALFAVSSLSAIAAEPDGAPGVLYNPSNNPSVVLRATYRYPDSISGVQNSALPGSVPNDRMIPLGAIFSGLFRDPADPFLTFWGISDRGPNQEIPARTFPIPEFNPVIVFLRLQASRTNPAEIKLYEPFQIRNSSGQPVTGLPNRKGVDEVPYSYDGTKELTYNMDGMDTEGVVRTSRGEFWICEEYGPSIAHVGADGVVKTRYVPADAGYTNAGYPLEPTLPAVFAKRQPNRGFESIALSSDGETIHVLLQSPLANPDTAAGRASQIIRVLAVNTKTGKPSAEYVYVMEPGSSFGGARQRDMKISAAATVNPSTLLVDERTDPIARLYTFDFSKATNILGTKWDSVTQTPSLESLTPQNLEANGIVPGKKKLVLDANLIVGNLPEKIEGIAILDKWTVALGNDNDFALDTFDGEGNFKIKIDQLCELIAVRLAEPLPLE